MKKIIASILVVFFVVLSPISAFASTTESMMMFFTGSRSIPTGYQIPFRPISMTESGSFSYGPIAYAQDGSSSRITSSLTLSGDVSNTLVGYVFDVSSTITGSSAEGVNLSISEFDYWIYSYDSNTSYVLSPFASPVLAFVEVVGNYDFQLYDGSVGYERWIYDNSFTLIKPLSVQYSDFGLYQRNQTGSYSDNVSIGCNLTLSYDSVTVDDLLSDLTVRNRISDYISFTQTEISGVEFSSVEDFPTNQIRMSPTQATLVVLYNATPQNFVAFSNPYIGFPYGTLDNCSTSVRLAPTFTHNNTVSVDVYGFEGSFYDRTPLSLITSSASRLVKAFSGGLSNVVTNATDNANRIIQNTTQKVDEVKQGVTDVKNSVIDTKNSILDLPNKIKDMLLGLIVPSSETMANKYSEFSQLLEQKLGIIYQIPMMLFSFFDTIVNAATTPQSTLTLPAFTLPWIDGTTLTIWQPIEYKIIPDGMQVLSDLIQTVTSMTVVVLTFNSVKQAYERFLRS